MSVFDWPEARLTEDERQARGFRAAELLSDRVFREAFEEAERTFLSQWYVGQTTEEREKAHAKIHALHEIHGIFEAWATEAHTAQR